MGSPGRSVLGTVPTLEAVSIRSSISSFRSREKPASDRRGRGTYTQNGFSLRQIGGTAVEPVETAINSPGNHLKIVLIGEPVQVVPLPILACQFKGYNRVRSLFRISQ